MENSEFKIEDRKSVDWNFKEAIGILRVGFGVENLSNIELFHLRKITEDVMKGIENGQSGDDLGIIDPMREIPVRFLQELYGIDYYSMNLNFKTEKDYEGFVEYIRRLRDKAHLI